MGVRGWGSDGRAQSEATGALLLVALTIIIAGTLGVFVLDIGQNVEATPQSSFDTDFDDSTVTITYRGGSTIPTDETLETLVSSGLLTGDGWESVDGPITTGTSITLTHENESGATQSWNGETVRVVWTSADGGTTTVLVRTQAPR
ncbi:Protein of unknown function [Haloplanus vescus]|uniref:Archaeal Type IV pilin N-terminal domain-containing protein n=1 Tax=Haloplanus vescus TaxID=555874 RepID=A0A1H3W2U2_9EURY|nr:type IV pilin N-terminal domain-containing protein [Haloplanus vescus]SDZ81191.1 Protein of unknown function [Haloplanus vescus]